MLPYHIVCLMNSSSFIKLLLLECLFSQWWNPIWPFHYSQCVLLSHKYYRTKDLQPNPIPTPATNAITAIPMSGPICPCTSQAQFALELEWSAHAQPSDWAVCVQFAPEPGQAEHVQSSNWVPHAHFLPWLGRAGLLPPIQVHVLVWPGCQGAMDWQWTIYWGLKTPGLVHVPQKEILRVYYSQFLLFHILLIWRCTYIQQ